MPCRRRAVRRRALRGLGVVGRGVGASWGSRGSWGVPAGRGRWWMVLTPWWHPRSAWGWVWASGGGGFVERIFGKLKLRVVG